MKDTLILFIDFYQKLLSLFLKNIFGVTHFCRFKPTCSQYAKEALIKEGIFLGSYHSFVRLLKCQPFYKGEKVVYE